MTTSITRNGSTSSASKPAADLDARRHALRGWLGSGPIDSPTGAYFAWIEEGTGRAAFEYPEITGYALTYLMGRPEPSRKSCPAPPARPTGSSIGSAVATAPPATAGTTAPTTPSTWG